jgi:hypothetical protein
VRFGNLATCSLTKGIWNRLCQEPLVKGSRTDPLAKSARKPQPRHAGVQNGTRFMVGRLTLGVLRMFRLGLGMLTLGSGMLRLCSILITLSSGKRGSRSRPETKTEAAKMRLESGFCGNFSLEVMDRR